ncbi:MAG: HAD family hydrolase [Candidatus Aenigmatarchaeota archaeon]
MSIKLIAFDFDGVFLDSAPECHIIGLRAFQEMGSKLKDSPELKRNVRVARTFVVSFYDYYYVFRAIEEEGTDFSKIKQEDYDKLKEKYKDDNIEEYVKKAYGIRDELVEKSFDEWCNMQSIFPNIEKAYKKISAKHKTVIATAKDSKSTYKLLKNLGFDISEEDITGKEFSHKKADQMRKIAEVHNIKLDEILFVEDMLQNLKDVMLLGVKGALVGWGYSSSEQKEEAKKFGIPIIESNNIVEQIEEIINGECN